MPSIDQNKRLHIGGCFLGNTVQLNFELIFEPVNGQWRLFGIPAAPVKPPGTNASPPMTEAGTKNPLPRGKVKEGSQ
jgi:hypothetical protein